MYLMHVTGDIIKYHPNVKTNHSKNMTVK